LKGESPKKGGRDIEGVLEEEDDEEDRDYENLME
jgi:hypothetical protein